MKKSFSLLLLSGVTCCLLHLVQEGQGLTCYVGAGFPSSGIIEKKRDCQDEAEKDLHTSCKKDSAERDYCVTSALSPNGPNPLYAKKCGCSKGLDSGELTPECAVDTLNKVCACNTDLCNNIHSAPDPPPPPPPAPPASEDQDHGGSSHSLSGATFPVPALFLLLTSALTPFFYWILY